MRAFLIFGLIATTTSLPTAVATAQQPAANPPSASAPLVCGRRGKNGSGRCMVRLRDELKKFCELRTYAISRFGASFGELPEMKRAEQVCLESRAKS